MQIMRDRFDFYVPGAVEKSGLPESSSNSPYETGNPFHLVQLYVHLASGRFFVRNFANETLESGRNEQTGKDLD